MSTPSPSSSPRILHQTWKDTRVPWQWRAFQHSWRHHHPGWEYRLWTDFDLRELIRTDYAWFLPTYDAYREHIKRVDAARYFIMHRFGGVYADLDFESFRPIDELLAEREIVLVHEPYAHLDLTVVQQSGLQELISNAFIASRAGHPFWEHVFHELAACSRKAGPLDATGPFFLTRALRCYPNREGITLVPPEQLCPITSQEAWDGALRDPDARARIASLAYGAHHWSGSWFHDARESARERAAPERFTVTLAAGGETLFTDAIDLGHARARGTIEGRSRRISCMMVTRGRASHAARAIRCFQEQSYDDRELVIVDDDDDDTLFAHVRALGDPRIVHVREAPNQRPLGALRNIAVARASGSFVCQWDDDDLYHPRRLELQLAALEATMADACFLANNHIWWPRLRRLAKSKLRAWEGSILCAKSRMHHYPELKIGEDTFMVQSLVKENRVAVLDAPELYVYIAHGDNTFAVEHFEKHWADATEKYEGASYDAKLDALLASLRLERSVTGIELPLTGSNADSRVRRGD